MRRSILATLFGSVMSIVLGATLPASAETAITEQEAHAIGVNAYLYFYPLLTMDLTRRQSTNIEPRQGNRQGSDEHVLKLSSVPGGRQQARGAI
jgi:hypothetical protein